MSRNFALIFVGAAGILWASSGVAVQDFFSHSEKSAMELTNIRMCLSGALLILLATRRKKFFVSLGLLNRHVARRDNLRHHRRNVHAVHLLSSNFNRRGGRDNRHNLRVPGNGCGLGIILPQKISEARRNFGGRLGNERSFFARHGRQPDKIARAARLRGVVFVERRGVRLQRDFPQAFVRKKN